MTPYGSWKSPITSDLIVAGTVGLGQIQLDGAHVCWIEARATEGGRNVVVCWTPDSRASDVTPSPFNARTRVHEYGGGSFVVSRGVVYFSHFPDQRLYRQTENEAPQPLTAAGAMRFADAVIDSRRHRLIGVCEDHTAPGKEPINSLVGVDLTTGVVTTLVSGSDFYSSPRLSPDGSRLAWLSWSHPNMPWDKTELWVGEFTSDGQIGQKRHVTDGGAESVFQPTWSPDGVLHFVSDRTGWWNLYRWRDGYVEPLCPMEAEFGRPQWVFGMSTYAFVAPDRLACAYSSQGTWRLALLDTTTHQLTPVATPYTEISDVRATPTHIIFVGGSPTEPASIVRLDVATQQYTVLRRATTFTLDSGYLSSPQAIEFPTEHGLTAHALFYPPRNRDYTAPDDERPPLLVKSHGGPTAAAQTTLNLGIQYWTSRGIAVLDVNYGGSSGYGRAYRDRLKGQWGIVDVDDCVNGARYLVEKGLVDGNRLAITGGSAGGYTTLCALTFRNFFKAGASHYGICDLEALAHDTHKFEARYEESLVGPYPARRDLYRARSPIHFTERLSCPVIFFQGLDDKVVPPNQAEMMVAALRAKGLPVAYLPFAGEQHGFRKAENIKRALDAELYFYSRVFGFSLADTVEPAPIENFPEQK
ncbi:MAG TPA: S9 family peptidase [Methylomirabilota bacterium]|jgi:dipeptidyl aminopeptidase/acylaminoacyl peptidase|nr:S9 family peptidase [Methylomirabilota bacterium]